MSEQNEQTPPKAVSRYQRIVTGLWSGLGIGIIGLLVYLLLVDINFLFLFGASPSLEKLENPRTDQA